MTTPDIPTIQPPPKYSSTVPLIVRPWYTVIAATITDVTVASIIGVNLHAGKITGGFGETLAIIVLALIAGVRLTDLSNAIRNGVPMSGSGPSLILFTAVGHLLQHLVARSRG